MWSITENIIQLKMVWWDHFWMNKQSSQTIISQLHKYGVSGPLLITNSEQGWLKIV